MKRLEKIFHVAAIVIQSGGVIPLILRTADTGNRLGESNSINTIAMAVILVLTLWLILHYYLTIPKLDGSLLIVLTIVGLAFLSVEWSNYPDVTLRRATSLMTTTLWAFYLSARLDFRECIRLFAQAIGLIAVASLVLGVGFPAVGRGTVDDPQGWRGIFALKNNLGDVTSLGVTIFFYLLCVRGGSPLRVPLNVAGIIMCGILLALSQSRTSWIIGIGGPIVTVVVLSMYERVSIVILAWTIALVAILISVVFAPELVGSLAPLLGRSSNLSGRVGLWAEALSYAGPHLWLGHGFGAFWVADNPDVESIWRMTNWDPPNAHNGWIDLVLELGIAGGGLMIIELVALLASATRAIARGLHRDSCFVLIILTLILIHNMSESALVRPENLMWALIVMSAGALAKIRQAAQTHFALSSRSKVAAD